LLAQQPDPRDSMAKVKLGRKEYYADSEEIWAVDSGVTVADCVALAARIKSGEIRRLKKLFLVRLFLVLCVLFYFICIHLSSALFLSKAIKSALTAHALLQISCAVTAVCSYWTLCVCVAAALWRTFFSRFICVLFYFLYLHLSFALFDRLTIISALTAHALFQISCEATAVCRGCTLCVCVAAIFWRTFISRFICVLFYILYLHLSSALFDRATIISALTAHALLQISCAATAVCRYCFLCVGVISLFC
jgi:hypothetical protein